MKKEVAVTNIVDTPEALSEKISAMKEAQNYLQSLYSRCCYA